MKTSAALLDPLDGYGIMHYPRLVSVPTQWSSASRTELLNLLPLTHGDFATRRAHAGSPTVWVHDHVGLAVRRRVDDRQH